MFLLPPQAEALFQRLSQAQTRFEEWVVLGGVASLEELVEQQCKDVSDWERNFRALKARGREAEKLPKYVCVCLWVYFRLVKGTR